MSCLCVEEKLAEPESSGFGFFFYLIVLIVVGGGIFAAIKLGGNKGEQYGKRYV